jgi:hypothetical protein
LASNGDSPVLVPGRWPDKQALVFHTDVMRDMTIPASNEIDFATPNPPARSFSVELWVKPDDVQPVDGSMVTHGMGLEDQYSIGILRGHFRGWTQYAKSNVGEGVSEMTGPPFTPGWHQLILTVNPSAKRSVFYVDGVSTAQVSSLPPMLLAIPTSPILVGARLNPDGTMMLPSFNGLIDELAIYARELSDAEVRALYDGGKP